MKIHIEPPTSETESESEDDEDDSGGGGSDGEVKSLLEVLDRSPGLRQLSVGPFLLPNSSTNPAAGKIAKAIVSHHNLLDLHCKAGFLEAEDELKKGSMTSLRRIVLETYHWAAVVSHLSSNQSS